jgi:hypothetical protein
VPEEELFAQLAKRGVRLDRNAFCEFARQGDTPEELADLLLPDGAPEKERDPFYLLVFELWRRLLPEKQSLSIFCDELDYRIALYDRGEKFSDDLLQDAIANLLEVLDENTDLGADPEDVFTAICNYCAHDLESFLYDYIAELLDSGNSLYASELVEGFSLCVTDPFWFDFLKTRLLAFTDVGDANLALHRLLENDLDFPLLLEMLHFLAAHGERELFSLGVQKTIPLLAGNEDWREAIEIIADSYARLGDLERERLARQWMEKDRPPAASEALSAI